jgi:hypothetical protein
MLVDTNVFMIAALRSGLGLWAVGIKPHRTWTSLRKALDQATLWTGQPYKGRKDIERARTDLTNLLIRMKEPKQPAGLAPSKTLRDGLGWK